MGRSQCRPPGFQSMAVPLAAENSTLSNNCSYVLRVPSRDRAPTLDTPWPCGQTSPSWLGSVRSTTPYHGVGQGAVQRKAGVVPLELSTSRTKGHSQAVGVDVGAPCHPLLLGQHLPISSHLWPYGGFFMIRWLKRKELKLAPWIGQLCVWLQTEDSDYTVAQYKGGWTTVMRESFTWYPWSLASCWKRSGLRLDLWAIANGLTRWTRA